MTLMAQFTREALAQANPNEVETYVRTLAKATAEYAPFFADTASGAQQAAVGTVINTMRSHAMGALVSTIKPIALGDMKSLLSTDIENVQRINLEHLRVATNLMSFRPVQELIIRLAIITSAGGQNKAVDAARRDNLAQLAFGDAARNHPVVEAIRSAGASYKYTAPEAEKSFAWKMG